VGKTKGRQETDEANREGQYPAGSIHLGLEIGLSAMIAWWKQRVACKNAREMVAGTRKLLRIHRDIMDAGVAAEVAAAADGLADAIHQGAVADVEKLTENLESQLEKAFPRQSYSTLRENVEVFLVAAIVAMAVRSFFIQPFKIPTGSMQPTLYGVFPGRYPESQPQPPIPYSSDQPAPLSETVSQLALLCKNLRNDLPSQVRRPSLPILALGSIITGTIFERDGYRTRGDHIFVDRFTYHFRKPHRGEVIVFDTSDILKLPEGSRGKFYIKRLIGLPGDTVAIQPPRVLVNGEVLNGLPFLRNYSRGDGYHGYLLPYWDRTDQVHSEPEFINSNVSNTYQIPDKCLFVLGDNSASSLDGRFWGTLPQKALVGRAVFVYWPFSVRFGFFDNRKP
jgi:signal peptidase I